MSLVMNQNCPKCQGKRTKEHCKSPTCTWLICKTCTTGLKSAIFVFDKKNRTMEGKG